MRRCTVYISSQRGSIGHDNPLTSSNPSKYTTRDECFHDFHDFHDFHGFELIHGVKYVPHRQNHAEEAEITDSSVFKLLYI